MLPTNVFQFDYNILNNLINDKFSFMENYQGENGKYELIVGLSKSGIFPSFVLSNLMNIPFVNIEKKEVDDFLIEHKDKKSINILVVDSIVYDGSIVEIKKKLASHGFQNVSTYGIFVHSSVEDTPLFFNIIDDRYFMGPWSSNSFTPDTHLERIINVDVKKFPKNTFLYGFSSKLCLSFLKAYIDKKIPEDWIYIFSDENNKITLSSYNDNMTQAPKEELLNFYLYKAKPYMDNKISYIKSNGITHFFETNLQQSLIISDQCPTVHVFYVENGQIYRINSKKITSF